MSTNKPQRKAQVRQWQADQRRELAATMPLSADQLHRLLNFLDEHLGTCDHTTKLTDTFLHVEKLDKNAVLPWLGDYGGFCDCEVLANLADLDVELQRPTNTTYYAPEPKKKDAPRDLSNAMGWDLTKLPSSWRVGNLYARDEPIHLQIGKKTGCTLTIVEASMPPGDQTADEYWTKLWHDRVRAKLGANLPDRGPLRVRRDAIQLPIFLRSTVVDAPNWLPVHGWIVPDEGCWNIEIETDANRAAGDFKLIAALVLGLANCGT